jgi:hypothetical protein
LEVRGYLGRRQKTLRQKTLRQKTLRQKTLRQKTMRQKTEDWKKRESGAHGTFLSLRSSVFCLGA